MAELFSQAQEELELVTAGSDLIRRKNSHTLRRNWTRFWRESESKNIDININRNITSCAAEKYEYSVTPADDFFLKTLQGGKLNSKERWEDTLDTIADLNVSKKKEYSKWNSSVSVTYQIPVFGHLLISNNMESSSKELTNRGHNSWLYWNGIYYDPDYVYEHPKNNDFMRKLKILCPRRTPFPSFNDDKIVEFPFEVRHLRNQRNHRRLRVTINHKFHNVSGAGWKQTGQQRHLDIDLGKNRAVTHIGIAGMFPTTVKFPEVPPNEQNMYKYLNKKAPVGKSKIRRRRKRPQFVELLDDSCRDNASYITLFRLFRFDADARAWIEIGVHSANTDATTEKVIDIASSLGHTAGVITRFLRIEPLVSQNQPICRIAVYGRDIVRPTALCGEITAATEQAETVTYVVTHPMNASKVPESKYCRRGRRYDDYSKAFFRAEDYNLDASSDYDPNNYDYEDFNPKNYHDIHSTHIRVSPITIPPSSDNLSGFDRNMHTPPTADFCLSNEVWPSLHRGRNEHENISILDRSSSANNSPRGNTADASISSNAWGGLAYDHNIEFDDFEWIDNQECEWEWEYV